MPGSTAFVQRGNTKRITAIAERPSSSVRMSVATDMPHADNYILTNFGPSVAFVGYGSSSDEAINNAESRHRETVRVIFVLFSPLDKEVSRRSTASILPLGRNPATPTFSLRREKGRLKAAVR